MKHFRRYIVAVLCAVVLAVFTGCGVGLGGLREAPPDKVEIRLMPPNFYSPGSGITPIHLAYLNGFDRMSFTLPQPIFHAGPRSFEGFPWAVHSRDQANNIVRREWLSLSGTTQDYFPLISIAWEMGFFYTSNILPPEAGPLVLSHVSIALGRYDFDALGRGVWRNSTTSAQFIPAGQESFLRGRTYDLRFNFALRDLDPIMFTFSSNDMTLRTE